MKKIFKFILLLLFFVVIFIMLFSNKNDGSTANLCLMNPFPKVRVGKLQQKPKLTDI